MKSEQRAQLLPNFQNEGYTLKTKRIAANIEHLINGIYTEPLPRKARLKTVVYTRYAKLGHTRSFSSKVSRVHRPRLKIEYEVLGFGIGADCADLIVFSILPKFHLPA